MKTFEQYIFIIIICVISLILLHMYKQKMENNGLMDDQLLIQKYLYNGTSLGNSKKPILWIPIELETNSRWLPHGFSGPNKCLSQPYLYLTMKSIIDKCGEDFQIVIITDESFEKIIPNWNIKVDNLPNPLKSHLRELAMAKLLYTYGGMCIPPNFICLKNISDLYKTSLNICPVFVGEMVCRSVLNENVTFYPSNKIMGCIKENEIMGSYIKYLEQQVSDDYTNESDFARISDSYLYNEVLNKRIVIVDGQSFGVKNKHQKMITIDELMGEIDLQMNNHALGIYIPADELIKRQKYNWFVRLSAEQVLQSNTMIGRYLLLCNH